MATDSNATAQSETQDDVEGSAEDVLSGLLDLNLTFALPTRKGRQPEELETHDANMVFNSWENGGAWREVKTVLDKDVPSEMQKLRVRSERYIKFNIGTWNDDTPKAKATFVRVTPEIRQLFTANKVKLSDVPSGYTLILVQTQPIEESTETR